MTTTQSDLELWPIGNCQVSGLIDSRGGLVWGCVPRVDGDPAFCALLNGECIVDENMLTGRGQLGCAVQ